MFQEHTHSLELILVQIYHFSLLDKCWPESWGEALMQSDTKSLCTLAPISINLTLGEERVNYPHQQHSVSSLPNDDECFSLMTFRISDTARTRFFSIFLFPVVILEFHHVWYMIGCRARKQQWQHLRFSEKVQIEFWEIGSMNFICGK